MLQWTVRRCAPRVLRATRAAGASLRPRSSLPLQCAVHTTACSATATAEPIAHSAHKKPQKQKHSKTSGAIETPPTPLPLPPMQYLSFFLYTHVDPSRLEQLRLDIRALMGTLGSRGRILIASEGINAQMCTPVGTVQQLETGFKQMHDGLLADIRFTLGDVCEAPTSGSATTTAAANPPATSARRSFAGAVVPLLPFEVIDVRIRPRIVTDGLDEATHAQMDLRDHGEGLSPAQWHAAMTSLPSSTVGTRLLDCRNWFESEIGSFEGSTPLGTDLYSQSFEKLDEIVDQAKAEVAAAVAASPPPSTYIYCTGGIRCVKVGAYLRSKKYPFPVKFLDGGINAYWKYVEEAQAEAAATAAAAAAAGAPQSPSPPLVSTFKGVNFVFDARVKGGAARVRVTEDVLGTCHQCGSVCDEHVNCENLRCDVLFVQCAKCAGEYEHTCSDACRTIVRAVKANRMSFDELAPHPGQRLYRRRVGLAATVPNPWAAEAERMAPLVNGTPTRSFHSSARRFRASTAAAPITAATVSANAAALDAYCVAHSTPPTSGDLLDTISSYTHITMPERANMLSDPLVGSVLRALLQASLASSTAQPRVLEIGAFTGYATTWLLDALPLHGTLVSCEKSAEYASMVSAHLARHPKRGQLDLRVAPAMDTLEGLAREKKAPFDFIYLDANKKSYLAYYEYLLAHQLLKRGGIFLVDNTLWHGQVAADPSHHDSMTRAMATFNDRLRQDTRVIATMLPIRDGLTIVQWRS